MSTHRIPCQTFGQLRQIPGTSLSLDWWHVSLLDQSVDPTNQYQTNKYFTALYLATMLYHNIDSTLRVDYKADLVIKNFISFL